MSTGHDPNLRCNLRVLRDGIFDNNRDDFWQLSIRANAWSSAVFSPGFPHQEYSHQPRVDSPADVLRSISHVLVPAHVKVIGNQEKGWLKTYLLNCVTKVKIMCVKMLKVAIHDCGYVDTVKCVKFLFKVCLFGQLGITRLTIKFICYHSLTHLLTHHHQLF